MSKDAILKAIDRAMDWACNEMNCWDIDSDEYSKAEEVLNALDNAYSFVYREMNA